MHRNEKIYLFFWGGILITSGFVSCKDDAEKATGTAVFGANYHVINCISYVDVFIDGKHIGQLGIPADSVPDCDLNYGFREELKVGAHNYRIEIRPEMGTGCIANVEGVIDIIEGGCETVFIDCYEIDFSN